MPRVVKFALIINDNYIDTLDDLKKNFNIEKIIGYFNDGRLLRWLKAHRYEEEASKVESIEIGDENLPSRLYEIFCVEPPTDLNLDVEETVKRHHRLERLKTYTTDPKILSKVDSVAFNQNELYGLIKNDVAEIYLCSGEFVIPLDVRDKTYIGIEKVTTIIKSEVLFDFDSLNIQFKNISFDANYEKIPRTTDKMYEFAKSYYDKQNFEKAFEWYKKAADNGNTDAMNALGYCYEYGKGVKQNSEKAFG
ncbi:MAG: sel1 repeat family protein [Selenomonadaceae bacterium]|nr:sel1 repeat family protein [Selenomonadaceae bacterium]